MSARSPFEVPSPTRTRAWLGSVRAEPCSTPVRECAAAAGVDFREGFTVDDVLVTDGRVVGVRGHGTDAKPVEERARVVIGADGVDSLSHDRYQRRRRRSPGRRVRVHRFQRRRQDDIELYVRDRYAFGGAPTTTVSIS